MSEPMAIEKLTAEYLKLSGYSIEIRIPYFDESNIKQAKDIDVIGIRSNRDRLNLILAECKAHGAPNSYHNYFTSTQLLHIQEIICKMSELLKQDYQSRILSNAWKGYFDPPLNTSITILLVLNGTFFPKSNPQKRVNHKNPLVAKILDESTSIYNERKDDKEIMVFETQIISLVERILLQEYQVSIKILPIHRMIHSLFMGVKWDMMRRRKRYPDTSLEMIRWIIRSIENGAYVIKDMHNIL